MTKTDKQLEQIEKICRDHIIGHVVSATVVQLVEKLANQAYDMQRQRDMESERLITTASILGALERGEMAQVAAVRVMAENRAMKSKLERHCGTCEYSHIQETIRVCEHMDIGLYCSDLGNICGRWEAKTNEG